MRVSGQRQLARAAMPADALPNRVSRACRAANHVAADRERAGYCSNNAGATPRFDDVIGNNATLYTIGLNGSTTTSADDTFAIDYILGNNDPAVVLLVGVRVAVDVDSVLRIFVPGGGAILVSRVNDVASDNVAPASVVGGISRATGNRNTLAACVESVIGNVDLEAAMCINSFPGDTSNLVVGDIDANAKMVRCGFFVGRQSNVVVRAGMAHGDAIHVAAGARRNVVYNVSVDQAGNSRAQMKTGITNVMNVIVANSGVVTKIEFDAVAAKVVNLAILDPDSAKTTAATSIAINAVCVGNVGPSLRPLNSQA